MRHFLLNLWYERFKNKFVHSKASYMRLNAEKALENGFLLLRSFIKT